MPRCVSQSFDANTDGAAIYLNDDQVLGEKAGINAISIVVSLETIDAFRSPIRIITNFSQCFFFEKSRSFPYLAL